MKLQVEVRVIQKWAKECSNFSKLEHRRSILPLPDPPETVQLHQPYLERLFQIFGEGNGNPLQYSCLENLTDRGAWQATVHAVAKSQTWLSDWTTRRLSWSIWGILDESSFHILFVVWLLDINIHLFSPKLHQADFFPKPSCALNQGVSSA